MHSYAILLPISALAYLYGVSAQGVYTLPYDDMTVPITPCPEGAHVIGVSGEGSPDVGNYGLLSSLIDDISSAIPGSTNQPLPYPKQELEKGPLVNAGVLNLQAYINDFHDQCPQSPIVLAGYSSGAVITMNSLCGGFAPFEQVSPINASLSNNIIATITYGDETRATGQPYDEGTCTSGAPNVPRTNTDACAPFSTKLQSYCQATDPKCCASGTNISTHYVYPDLYDSTASQYVAERYQAYVASKASAQPSSATPSSISTSSTSSSTTPETSQTTASSSSTATSTPIFQPGPTARPSTTTTIFTTMTTTIFGVPTAIVTDVAGNTDAGSGHDSDDDSNSASNHATPAGSRENAGSGDGGGPSDQASTNAQGGCPAKLEGDWQFPHLMVPISSENPDKALGTSYFGNVSSTISTIYNFDVPESYSGKTCSLIFFLPEEKDLNWSRYDIVSENHDDKIHAEKLANPADDSTSWNHAPAQAKDLGSFKISASHSQVIASSPCEAGQTVAYEMSGESNFILNYFQTSTKKLPIGLYMRAC